MDYWLSGDRFWSSLIRFGFRCVDCEFSSPVGGTAERVRVQRSTHLSSRWSAHHPLESQYETKSDQEVLSLLQTEWGFQNKSTEEAGVSHRPDSQLKTVGWLAPLPVPVTLLICMKLKYAKDLTCTHRHAHPDRHATVACAAVSSTMSWLFSLCCCCCCCLLLIDMSGNISVFSKSRIRLRSRSRSRFRLRSRTRPRFRLRSISRFRSKSRSRFRLRYRLRLRLRFRSRPRSRSRSRSGSRSRPRLEDLYKYYLLSLTGVAPLHSDGFACYFWKHWHFRHICW